MDKTKGDENIIVITSSCKNSNIIGEKMGKKATKKYKSFHDFLAKNFPSRSAASKEQKNEDYTEDIGVIMAHNSLKEVKKMFQTSRR